MTTTTRHTFWTHRGEHRLWGIVAAAVLVGALIGATTTSVVWMTFTELPAMDSAIHSPVLDVADAEAREELDRTRHSLEMNRRHLRAVQTDPRWQIPTQRAGLTYALQSTTALIEDQQARVEALEARLGGSR
jgi:hypothetical protein